VNKLPDTAAAATVVLPAAINPAPTIEVPPPPVASVHQAIPATIAAQPKKRRSLLPWIIGAALLIPFLAGVVAGGWMLFHKQPLKWHLTLDLDPTVPNRDAAVGQTVKVLETRLNAYGVSNFQVTPQSNGRLMLDLSNERDPERLKSFITMGGKLDLTHVISPPSPSPVQSYATKEEAISSLNSGGTVPANRRVLPYAERDETDDPPGGAADIPGLYKWVVVEWPAIVDGSDLRTASAVPGISGRDYEIQFSLKKVGAEKFGAWTGANIDQYLGVVLNDKVRSIAYIKSQISDSGVISGRFTKESAEDLALVLKSGALPASLKIVDEKVDK